MSGHWKAPMRYVPKRPADLAFLGETVALRAARTILRRRMLADSRRCPSRQNDSKLSANALFFFFAPAHIGSAIGAGDWNRLLQPVDPTPSAMDGEQLGTVALLRTAASLGRDPSSRAGASLKKGEELDSVARRDGRKDFTGVSDSLRHSGGLWVFSARQGGLPEPLASSKGDQAEGSPFFAASHTKGFIGGFHEKPGNGGHIGDSSASTPSFGRRARLMDRADGLSRGGPEKYSKADSASSSGREKSGSCTCIRICAMPEGNERSSATPRPLWDALRSTNSNRGNDAA